MQPSNSWYFHSGTRLIAALVALSAYTHASIAVGALT
jgi:hypothetical protein